MIAVYSVTVRGFGHIRTLKVSAQSPQEAEVLVLAKCGIAASARLSAFGADGRS